jgi:tetratricopeptide (TPR) repeat protein
MKQASVLTDWAERSLAILSDPNLAIQSVKRCNNSGEYLLAIEIAETVLKENKGHLDAGTQLTLQQQLVLALARTGLVARARALIEKLHLAGVNDGETLGLLGSVYKVLSGKAETPDEKLQLLSQALKFYQSGFDKAGSAYCAINASALLVLLGDLEAGKLLAEGALTAHPQGEPYWDTATMAEANLILGRLDQARQGYADASKLVGDNWAGFASTRKQCRLLCLKLHGRREFLDDCFPSGTVVFFAGHIVDAVDRAQPRFPTSAIPSVRERIQAWIDKNAVRFTYSSAACGADILFLEAAQAAGADTHIILPFRKEDFVNISVRLRGEEWVARFEVVAENASLTVLSDDVPDFRASSFEFTNRMIAARAAARAVAYDVPLSALAVWDGQTGDGSGGTADAVVYWAQTQVHVDVIHPTNPQLDRPYDPDNPPPRSPFPAIYTASPRQVATTMAALLYLRFKGYESIQERDFQPFSQRLIEAVAEMMAVRGWCPARYGFGGHYLFVWNKVRDAGIAAIEFNSLLQVAVQETNLKVASILCLHSAALQLTVNPILNQYTHEGTAISKVQALSEILDPGNVFATEPFAEFTVFEKVRDFTCEYAGTVGVSKESRGTRIYQVSK